MNDHLDATKTHTMFPLFPDTDTPVHRPAAYAGTLLLLAFWLTLSVIPHGNGQTAIVGPALSPAIAMLALSPYVVIPAFLLFAVRTNRQWRFLIMTVPAGMVLNLALLLLLPASSGEQLPPLQNIYNSLQWNISPDQTWAIALPGFSTFWSIMIYAFFSSGGTNRLLRIPALAWLLALCLAPINTGLVGHADILGSLVIAACVLACMHLTGKRRS